MSLQAIAQQIAAQGRGNDDQLVHMSRREVAGLQALAAQHGMRLPRNPQTGLIEANFLDSILPAVAGIGLMAFAPELAPFIGEGAAGFLGTSTGAGLAVGGAEALASGSLKKGLTAGLGAYGGAELGGALGAAGSAAPVATGISAAPTVGASASGFGAGDLSAFGVPTTTVPAATGFGAGDLSAFGVPTTSVAAAPDLEAIPGVNSAVQSAAAVPPPTANYLQVANPTTSLSNMGQGLTSLGDKAGRTAFMNSLGSTGPFESAGYNQLFKAGAIATPALFDQGMSMPNPAQTNLQNTVRPWTLVEAPGSGMGTSGGTAINYKWIQGQPYNAITGKNMAGGGLTPGSTPGEGMHRTISQMRGVEHLMKYSGGGISNLGSYSDGGQLLRGPGDGVSDSIPARIGQHQPARLAEGEFVVPARIVSELGNGSTNAGAKQLYAMIDRIQNDRKRTLGSKHAYANDTKASKALPA